MSIEHWIHPEWLPHYKHMNGLVKAATGDDYITIVEAFHALPVETRDWLINTLMQGKVNALASSAFVVPVLSETACKFLADREYDYKENTENELEEYRIPEVVLEAEDPELFITLFKKLSYCLAPWFAMIWSAQPSNVTSIQLAKYNPTRRDKGTWHIDRDSNFTAVVSLNPDEFTGGGTQLADGPFGVVELPPLPKGYALIFDGKRTYHQGLPVTEGDRKLLVIWSEKKVN